MRAVQFDRYGEVDVLYIAQVPTPTASEGRVVVQVKAAGLNPGEIPIRAGNLHDRWPATFPSGQGTDFAGVVADIGPGVDGVDGVDGVAVGDEVVGWSEERSSHAEYVSVPATQVVAKPAAVSWEAAGGTYVAAGAAWACVTAVNAQQGETVVVSGAAGGVGSIAVQLLHARGAHVVALASPANQEFLESLHATFVDYAPSEGLDERITAAAGETGVDAWIDVYGGGYVQLAVDMGIAPHRINTIIDFAAAAELGTQALGTHDVTDAAVLAQILAMEADGRLRIPIAATYPLEQVREAQTELANRHTRGKIVLLP